MADVYDHRKAAQKWSKKWRDEGVYRVDLAYSAKASRAKFYNLMMFPYPSAEGLHVGNMYAFTGADWFGRFQAMQGKNVFEPIGLDGFGIHSENYALKVGQHPADLAKVSQKHFYDQLSKLGNRFNWEQKLETYDPEYYRWTQWLFVKMFAKGLAYRKASKVNWCPSCKTVLADEQVEDGRCERCKTETTKKETEQWFFKITDYADRLLNNLEKINWPNKITTAQRNWIGKKEGTLVTFNTIGAGTVPASLRVFTTRLDTLRGVTFLVISPELAQTWLDGGWQADQAVKDYVTSSLQKSDQKRLAEAGDKTGVATGVTAINPLTDEAAPVWVADYVLAGVGTGAVMGVPGYDERDMAFAKKFSLPTPKLPLDDEEEIFKKLKGAVKKETTYHLRDWLISRQRYWGPPIPMIYCDSCAKNHNHLRGANSVTSKVDRMPGWFAVPEEDLPVLLPEIKDYQPTGDGKSPLEKAPKSWLTVNCPNCGGKAKRETDVSDTFLDSAWYFLRYPSIEYTSQEVDSATTSEVGVTLPFNPEINKKWLPVDAYIGGAEHAVLHLMYSRFVWMALQDFGELDRDLGPEPFPFLYSHGLIIKDGNKMSKSRGNVVNPDEYIEDFGADALRMYLMFLGPYDQGGDFRDTGMRGMSKFLDRVWRLVENHKDLVLVEAEESREVLVKLHQTVKKVTEDMGQLKFNTSIAALMGMVNFLEAKTKSKTARKGKNGLKCAEWEEALQKLVLMLSPMAPFLAEELWHQLRGKFSVHQQPWPKFEETLAKSETVTVVAQVNGKVRGQFELSRQEANNKEVVLKLAHAQERVKMQLKDKKVLKEIFLPGKLVNLVV